MKELGKMNLESFLAYPLTTDGLHQLREETSQALAHLLRRTRWIGVLAGIGIIAGFYVSWDPDAQTHSVVILFPVAVAAFSLMAYFMAAYYEGRNSAQYTLFLLTPAPPYECAAALTEALKYPEVEQFRKDLLRNEREYLTVWEQKAIMGFGYDHAKAEETEQARARCQQFMTADTLSGGSA